MRRIPTQDAARWRLINYTTRYRTCRNRGCRNRGWPALAKWARPPPPPWPTPPWPPSPPPPPCPAAAAPVVIDAIPSAAAAATAIIVLRIKVSPFIGPRPFIGSNSSNTRLVACRAFLLLNHRCELTSHVWVGAAVHDSRRKSRSLIRIRIVAFCSGVRSVECELFCSTSRRTLE
jgi:hypothetical protein